MTIKNIANAPHQWAIKKLTQDRAIEWLRRKCWSVGQVHWLFHGHEPASKLAGDLPPAAHAGDDVERLISAIRTGLLKPNGQDEKGEPVYSPADVIRVAEDVDFGCWAIWKNLSAEVAAVGQDAPAGKVKAVPTTSPSGDADTPLDTTGLVYWRAVLYSNIERIDKGKKASPRQVIKYLRALGDSRLPNEGGHDELFWIDDNGKKQRVVKKTVGTATSTARKLRQSFPACCPSSLPAAHLPC